MSSLSSESKQDHSERDLEPGDILGRYQILFAVGQGGMGRVWVARQLGSSLERLVAIKTALGGQGQTREFRRLFMDEARIASMIHHPHVCGVHELGEQAGTWFLVMEWCDGASLRQLIDNVPGKKFNFSVATRIVANVAAGLHAAHELEDSEGTKLEVVHRDVSPQNILVSKNGHVKVTDFGVARARGQLHRPTETGEMKGKLAYMAPEQVTAKAVDRRADVFAIGCVLYEMTVGQRPFQGEGALSTLYQLLEQSVTPPNEIDPAFPEELSVIILKALAKDANERFDTAEQLRVALESWLATTGEPGTEREVAALLADATGDLILERSSQLRAALQKFKTPLPHVRAELPDSNSTSTKGSRPKREGASTVDRGVVAGPVPERSSSWFLPIGAAAAVLAVVVVLANGRGGNVESNFSHEPAQHKAVQPLELSAQADSQQQQQPRAPVVERIRLTVRTEPAGAQLRLDNGPPVVSPLVVDGIRDGSLHTLRASAPGRVERTQTVLYDGDHELVITLQELPSKPKVQGRPRKNKPAAPSRAPSQTKATVTALPRAEPSTVKKPKRRGLDSDNPFAQ